MYKVSIIVLNWNGDKHIHKCLTHLMDQSYNNIEVIIVDNNSTDGSIDKIKSNYPSFIYIINSSNKGYAAGMNQGILVSTGKFIIPLNQDVCLHADFVSECVQRINEDQTIGVIGGRVYSWIGNTLTDQLRHGEGEHTYWRKRFQGMGGIFVDDSEAFVFAPCGSLPFFRKKTLADIKNSSGDYFDEDYGTGWEDVDLFFRLHLRGWRCLFLPRAFGWHVGSGSVGGNATLVSKKLDYQIRVLRNRYFTMIKNLPIDIIIWLSPYLLFTELCLIPYFLLRSPKTVIALAAAWYQTLMKLPTLLNKRKLIQNNIVVPKGYLKQFFHSY
jgi:GT2 family glycosyltransferase